MMKCKGIEHGIISAGIDSEIMLNGCLSIIDMAVQALADVEDCNDVRGSLYHCRIMLQLLMPDDDNTVYEDEELEAARQEARARETETRPKAYGVDACKCKGVRGERRPRNI
jgi:hypothetical protein